MPVKINYKLDIMQQKSKRRYGYIEVIRGHAPEVGNIIRDISFFEIRKKTVGRPQKYKPQASLDMSKVSDYADKQSGKKKPFEKRVYVSPPLAPDPPKKPLQRPPAIYDNKTPYGIAKEIFKPE